jgi:hypothetical protein
MQIGYKRALIANWRTQERDRSDREPKLARELH